VAKSSDPHVTQNDLQILRQPGVMQLHCPVTFEMLLEAPTVQRGRVGWERLAFRKGL